MGIKVPAGQCDIEFSYVTPGLKIGVVCTVGAAIILIIYYIVLKKVFRYKPNPNIHLYGEQQLTAVINHNAYIRTITRSVDEQLDKKAELPEEDKSTNSESVTASDEDKEYDEENDNDKAE